MGLASVKEIRVRLLILARSERFGTKIITETIVRVDLSQRPFKYWTEGEEEEKDFMTADT